MQITFVLHCCTQRVACEGKNYVNHIIIVIQGLLVAAIWVHHVWLPFGMSLSQKWNSYSTCEIWERLDEQQGSYNYFLSLGEMKCAELPCYAIWCIRTGAATYPHHCVLSLKIRVGFDQPAGISISKYKTYHFLWPVSGSLIVTYHWHVVPRHAWSLGCISKCTLKL